MVIIAILIAVFLFCSKPWAQNPKQQAQRMAAIEREQARIAKEQEKQAEQLAKHEAQIQKMYFKIEQCENDIAHFSALADKLREQREEMQAEIESITARLEHADGVLDPNNAKFDDRFSGASGAELYMDMYSTTLDDTRTAKQKQADAYKLRKRKDTLESKIITLDNRIYASEQKVSKAQFEKYQAETAINA